MTTDDELWLGVVEESVDFISGNGKTADWFANMVAYLEVEVKFDHDRPIGRAHVVSLSRQAWCYDVAAIAIDRWKPKSGI